MWLFADLLVVPLTKRRNNKMSVYLVLLLFVEVVNDELSLQYFMIAINNLDSPILSFIYLPVRVLGSSIG